MHVSVVDYHSPTAAEEFTDSLLNTGFGVITNHPLDMGLVDDIFREWSSFFDSEAVHAYTTTDSGSGYFPPQIAETAKGAAVKDVKEFFHVYPWAPYPSEVSDAALRYAEEAKNFALTLLDWVEQNTPDDVAANFSRPLCSMMDGSTKTLLRILRYPGLTGDEDDGALRAAAHEDINLLTVLPASDQPGLEVVGADGNWYEVPCDPGSLTVNTGEMLQLASRGYYKATTHRVVNPTGPSASQARMAMPLFLHPASDVVLADGRTAESFLQERIRELRGER